MKKDEKELTKEDEEKLIETEAELELKVSTKEYNGDNRELENIIKASMIEEEAENGDKKKGSSLAKFEKDLKFIGENITKDVNGEIYDIASHIIADFDTVT